MQFRFRAKFFPEDVSEELIQEVTQVQLLLIKYNFIVSIVLDLSVLHCSFLSFWVSSPHHELEIMPFSGI